jgi:hypothetical protein
MLQMMQQMAKMMGIEFPMTEPKPAAKTRKVKTVNVPPAFTEPTLMAMSRDQLKQLAGADPKERTRTTTLVQRILAKQATKPARTKNVSAKKEYLNGMKGKVQLTDDGVVITVLGKGKKNKNGEWSAKAAKHEVSDTVGKGDTKKEAMYNLNDNLPEGYCIGWNSNAWDTEDTRDPNHLLRSKKKARKRNSNKSSVLTADVS